YSLLWKFLLIMINISMTTGVWSEIRLEQSPSEVKRPGETVKMSCIISGYSMTSNNIHWIRQKPGRALEWIGRMDTGNNAAIKSRFTISRDDSRQQLYLQMNSLKTEDTAVYYCARDSRGASSLPEHHIGEPSFIASLDTGGSNTVQKLNKKYTLYVSFIE
uniref:Ig-like domain-containing protein n=1 Tax=Labrus bergylta TaxID=56723 RepID=A0A3Q3EWM3_9LABR